jgi:hypothetical protein
MGDKELAIAMPCWNVFFNLFGCGGTESNTTEATYLPIVQALDGSFRIIMSTRACFAPSV